MRQPRTELRLSDMMVAVVQKRLALRRKGGPLARLHSIRAIAAELRMCRNTVRAIDREYYLVPLPRFTRCRCGAETLGPCQRCRALAAAHAA
jgi:hypothetical protein